MFRQRGMVLGPLAGGLFLPAAAWAMLSTVQPGPIGMVAVGLAAALTILLVSGLRMTSEAQASAGDSAGLDLYKRVLDSIPVLVYAAKVGTRQLLFVGGAARQITGYAADELYRDPELSRRIIHPDDRARVREEYEKGLPGNDAFEVEFRIIHRDGHIVWLRSRVSCIRDPDGSARHVGVTHEITREKQIEAERRAERSLLKQHQAVLETVATCAQLFLTSTSWQDCLDEVLARIGQAVGASRAYVFERVNGQIELTSRWVNDPDNAAMGEQNHMADAGPFARWNELLSARQIIRTGVTDIGAAEQAAMDARGVKAVLQIPIFTGQQWWGLIGFDDCCTSRNWSEGEIDALRTLASLLGSAVQRSRIEGALQQANESLEANVIERTSALRESEGRLRAFLEALPDIAFILDEDGRYIDILAQNEGLLYEESATMQDRLLSEIFPPPEADAFLQVIRQTLATGQSQTYEYELQVIFGRRWFEARTAPIVTDGSPTRNVLWVARDVTARKRAEEALRQANEQLRATLNALPDLLFEVDREGRIVDYRAPNVSRLLLPPQQFLGRHIREVIPEPAAGIIMNACAQAYLQGSHRGAAYSLQLPEGERWFELSISVKGGLDSPEATLVVVTRDVSETKQAEQALRASEEKHRTLMERLNVGIMRTMLLPQPRIVHLNQACARIFGYDSVEEILSLAPSALYATPGARDGYLQALREQGSLRNYEINIRKKDGGIAVVSVTVTPHYNEQGEMDVLDGLIEDISDRKKVEEHLQLLSAAVKQSSEGIAVVTPRGEVLFANDAYAAMHLLSPTDLPGRELSVFHLPEQMDQVEAAHAEVRRSGRFHGIIWHVRSDGRTFPTLMSVSAMRDAAGQLIGIIGSAVDISEQLQDQAHRERLSRAIENAGEGIGTFDEDWRLSYTNGALSRIFGSTQSDILGRHWRDLFEENIAGQFESIQGLLRTQDRWTGMLRGRDPGGNRIPLAVTLAHIAQPEGGGMFIVNIRDQSEEEAHLAQIRKLTLEAATSLENERARLSRELHDELGQILTAINLNLAWLSARGGSFEPLAKQRLGETQQLVNQMLEAIRSLSTSLRPPILDTRGLLEAIRSYASGFARRAGFSCRVTASPSDLEVRDPLATVAFRIIQEALTNVARHSRASKCGIFLKEVPSGLEVQVRDNGVGAVPSRLSGVQSLGIAGMRERAVAVGGTVTVQNRNEGGVCVTARLPWTSRETEATE